MSRSVKKFAAGSRAGCKSRKKGKISCHRKFRRSVKLLYKMREAMDEWDLGGDGKAKYTNVDKDTEQYKKLLRK